MVKIKYFAKKGQLEAKYLYSLTSKERVLALRPQRSEAVKAGAKHQASDQVAPLFNVASPP